MSVDTYIYVDPKKFEVWMCIASCVCGHIKHCLKDQKSSLIGQGKTLEKAIKIADEYDIKNPLDIEYGFNLHLWCK